MKPTDITPYVWNRILFTHNQDTAIATAWLLRQTNESIWQYLLEWEGIIGYHTELHNLHQHLFHKHEVV